MSAIVDIKGGSGRAELVRLLDRSKPSLREIATKYLTEEQLCIMAKKMWSENRKLRNCSPDSFLVALFTACQYGLDPTGVGNQAHIIPYGKEAKFVRGWGGVITMAARKGIKIDTFAVYDGDEFEVVRQSNADGYFIGLHHKEIRVSTEGPGEVKAAYAVATSHEWAQPMVEVVWRHDIEKVRLVSASSNSPAWTDWYSEMARKTAVNRLAKRLPLFVDIKDNTGSEVKRVQVPINALPSEDAYSTPPKIIEEESKDAFPKQLNEAKVEAITWSLGLRERFPSIYTQLLGKKDVTKMNIDELTEALNKVQSLGEQADAESTKELNEHQQGEELGF